MGLAMAKPTTRRSRDNHDNWDMANPKHDEEPNLEKHDQPTAEFSAASPTKETPMWIHLNQVDKSAKPPVYNSTHYRSRTRTARLPTWSWAALLAIFLTICYLYGFSEIDLPGSDSISILRSKHNRLRIEKLPSKLLPQTGKHRAAGRLIIVGDVHGMKKELNSLLEKVNFNSKHDHLILAGDMIDKGSDSPGVIDLVMEVGATCVMGNHEHKAILGNMHDFRKLGKKRENWIKRCPHILRVGSLGKMGEVVVVHAGLMPGKKLKAQSAKHIMNMRTIDKHGKPSSRKEGVDWFKRWNQYQKTFPQEERSTVVYGHNSKMGLQDHAYTKGLDTGCVNGGKLTALVIEGGDTHHTSKFVDVDCINGR